MLPDFLVCLLAQSCVAEGYNSFQEKVLSAVCKVWFCLLVFGFLFFYTGKNGSLL